MKISSRESFTQPIISTIGLAVSIVSAISPIFSKDPVRAFFINEQLAFLAAFLAFVFGGVVIWMITEYYRYFEMNIGKVKERGHGFPEPWKRIGKKELVLLLLLTDLVAAFSFFYIKLTYSSNSPSVVLELTQAFLYIAFFTILVAIFSFLITSTMDRMNYADERDNFPWTVFNTLEKSRLISPGVEIYENRFLTREEQKELNVVALGPVRKIRVKTKPQDIEVIEVLMTNDGKEVLRVLKKGD